MIPGGMVIAGLEVDVPDRSAFLEDEGPRLLAQIPAGVDLGVGFIPRPRMSV